MKYFLLLLIALAAGGGYYEFRVQREHETAYRDKIGGFSIQVDRLTSQNAQLTSDNQQLTASLLHIRQQMDDLTTQIHAAESNAASAHPPPPAPAPAAP
jgi:outer membrane murein-binding lipoprotein Lpp